MFFPFTSVVRHELVRKLRAVRPFLLVVAAVSISSIIIVSAWPYETRHYFDMGREASLVILVSSFVTWCFAAMLVLPVYGGVSVVLERQQETFDQVFLTLITPAGIVVGKLLNTLGMYLLIMVAMAPLVATSYFLLGLDVSAFLVSVLIILSVAYSIASVSILCSVLSRSVLRALIRSFFFAAAAVGGAFFFGVYMVLVFTWILQLDPSTYFRSPEKYIFVFVPFSAAVAHTLEPEMIPVSIWGWTIVVQLLIGTLCLVVSANVVRRIALLPLQTVQTPLWKRVLGPRAPKGKPAPPISDRINPIYAREVNWEGFARTRQRRRTFFLVLLLGGGLLATLLIGGERYGNELMGYLWCGMLLVSVAVAAPMATANSVTREYELGNLDMLRMTVLRPHHIILGKTLAGLRGLSPLVMGLLVLFPLVLYGQWPKVDETLGICFISFGSAYVCALVGTSLGMVASVSSRRTTIAVIVAYVLNACVYFLLYVSVRFALEIAILFQELSIGRRQTFQGFIQIFDKFFMLTSPFLGLMENIDKYSHRGEYVTSYWLTNIAVCAGYSLLALWLAVVIFRRKWERAQR